MKYSFFLLIVLLIISFGCNSEGRFDNDAEFELLDSIIKTVEVELIPLQNEIERLAVFSSQLYASEDSLVSKANKEKFISDKAGWFRTANETRDESTVFVSLMASDWDTSINEVYLTEPLDREFKRIVEKHPMVAQVYYNSRNQLSRLFPPYDLVNTIAPDIDVTAFNFFYLGNEANNPMKKHLWIDEIYIDPAGRGWIMSIIHPVYYESDFKGVLGMDITLSDLMRYFLAKFEQNLVIIDKNGTIVAGSNSAIEALSMPPLKNHTYVQTILADNFRKEDFNLFRSKSKEVRQMAAKFLLEKENVFVFQLEGYAYRAYCRKMDLVNWYLLNLQH
nr:cysteine protease [Cytophagales bacterium]